MIFGNAHIKSLSNYFALILLLAALTGCVNYLGIHSHKKMANPAQFQTRKSIPKQHGQWPKLDWANQFGDPQLVTLINEAIACNPDLEAARARIKQAQALASNKAAALYPQANARGAIERVRFASSADLPFDIDNATFTQRAFLLNINQDLDLWGKNISFLREAISQEKAAEAAAQEASLSLATSVASTYNQLAYYYALRDVLKGTVAQREGLNKISMVRLRTGLDTKTQVYQSRSSTETARTQLIAAEGEIITLRQQLGVLLGGGPDRGLGITQPRLKMTRTPQLPDNLPLNLLGRRPDIVGARWKVEASRHGIKGTKARFYPDVNLVAGAAFLAFALSDITNTANVRFMGAAFSLPIFDAGALRAQLRGKYALYEEAVAEYNSTLNRALGEVATQLASIQSVDRQLGPQKEALHAAEHAYNLARVQYRTGLASQLVVLDAQLSYLNEQQAHLQLVTSRRNLQIALIKALGGGFAAPIC